MGQGSKHFAYYYGFITILYLVIMAIAFSLVASVAPDCQVKCPTLIDAPPRVGNPTTRRVCATSRRKS